MSRAVRQFPTPTRRAPLRVAGLLGVTLALGGCGGGRLVDPSFVATARPSGYVRWSDPAAGVELTIPRNWSITPEKAPLLAVFSSGPAIIALWRYPAPGRPALDGATGLAAALSALERAARDRQPALVVESASTASVAGVGAVILAARETIDARAREVRSEHVYPAGAELVLETSAPVTQFPGLDSGVFAPAARSLTLLDDGRPGRGPVSTVTTATGSPTSR